MLLGSKSAFLNFEVWVLSWFLCRAMVSSTTPGPNDVSLKLAVHEMDIFWH